MHSLSTSVYHNARDRRDKNAVFSASGFVVGYVHGDTLYKSISRERHFLKLPPAIGYDTCAIRQAKDLGAKWLEVRETDSDTIYRASIGLLEEKGFVFNRRHGDQIALPLAHWTIYDPAQPTLFEVV